MQQEPMLRSKIITYLKGIYDPEIPVNIYDLGLIYDIDIKALGGGYSVIITMTLTSAACPVGESLLESVRAIQYVDDLITDCHVELVFDPPWSMDKVSEEGKLIMNLL